MRLDLKDITILIPTYKRNNYLFKNLSFWENYNTNIIILDGGKTPISKKQFNSYKNNIKYFFYKNSSFEKRLYFGSKKVQTSFCVVIGDDELHEPNSLKKSMNFLKKKMITGVVLVGVLALNQTKNI